MANPYVIGSISNMPNGPGAGTDLLTALPSATAYGLGVLDNHLAILADLIIPPIQIKSGASGVSATGSCSLWLATSEDNTVWTDGLAVAVATNQASKLVTATLVATIAVTANGTTYYFPEFSVLGVLGYFPLYSAVVIQNQSGAALDTTAGNFSAKYLPITFA